MDLKIIKTLFFLPLVMFFLVCAGFVLAESGGITSSYEGTGNKIAPGEILPISIKLVNFGSQKRIDVLVSYKILNADKQEVYSESETVAVETTASFIKRIQLPPVVKQGQYALLSALSYPYQEDPAVSELSFTVENKVVGFFVSDLIIYFLSFILIIVALSFFIFNFTGWKQKHSVAFHDYSDKPKEQMIYYDILSDVLSQMRLRIGDSALEIAKDIPNLEINDKNGLIVNIEKDPAKIIALLIARYEKMSGQHISFSIHHRK